MTKVQEHIENYDNLNTYFFQLLAEGFEGYRYFKQKLVMRLSSFYRSIGVSVSLKEIWADVNLYMYFDENPEHTCRTKVNSNHYYGELSYYGD